MDIEKAKLLVDLVSERCRYEEILKSFEFGYGNEWQLKNNYTGAIFELSCDDWAEIKSMAQRRLDEITKKIEEF